MFLLLSLRLSPGTPGARRESFREEALRVKCLLLPQQVIHRAADLRLQDRWGFLLAALALLTLQPFLRRRQRSQHEASSFGEGPLEVGVADLLAAGALLLAGRLVFAAHQPCV